MKIKWKHKQNVGRIIGLSKEIKRMLKMGATFDLNPSYTIYYKNGKEIKREFKHVSLSLQNPYE
ncbi:hypothetical protein LCGC14_1177080 [marine sediment metagenome]|uniref:Uncharacterized protein n=1 Tax=marine sediment metagenome TaxID=412755 RepID=A0A0F9LT35_9ZZZZ